MPTRPTYVEQLIAEGEQIQERFRTLLSPAIELTPSIMTLLFHQAGIALKDPEKVAFMDTVLSGMQAEYFQSMNGVSGPNRLVPDYHMRHKERNQLHAKLRTEQPTLFVQLHYLLFQIASGLSWREANVVTPNYLRTLVGCAYHGGYVHQRIGIAYYRNLLELHKFDPDPECTGFCKTSLVWLAGKLLEEQKGFGLFKNEPVTDELLAVASALD